MRCKRGLRHPEGCVSDGIGNKCACCERGWRAEQEINEQV